MMAIRGPGGEAIAFVNRRPNAAANARLLKASPELLTVCKELLRAANAGERSFWHAANAAHALIAELEGRAP
jgi:hypothetical protein